MGGRVRSIAPVLKTGVRSRVPWVRIPPHPLFLLLPVPGFISQLPSGYLKRPEDVASISWQAATDAALTLLPQGSLEVDCFNHRGTEAHRGRKPKTNGILGSVFLSASVVT